MHRLVAAAAFAVHMGFLCFTVIGGFLAWFAPLVLMPHVAAALWGGRMATTRAACPLSRMENWGRLRAGLPQLHERGFIAHYFENRLYPAGWARRVQVLASCLVLGSWLGVAIR